LKEPGASPGIVRAQTACTKLKVQLPLHAEGSNIRRFNVPAARVSFVLARICA